MYLRSIILCSTRKERLLPDLSLAAPDGVRGGGARESRQVWGQVLGRQEEGRHQRVRAPRDRAGSLRQVADHTVLVPGGNVEPQSYCLDALIENARRQGADIDALPPDGSSTRRRTLWGWALRAFDTSCRSRVTPGRTAGWRMPTRTQQGRARMRHDDKERQFGMTLCRPANIGENIHHGLAVKARPHSIWAASERIAMTSTMRIHVKLQSMRVHAPCPCGHAS